MWPGLVGKGPGAEPFIDLETMLDLTAKANVEGTKFDGVDLFLFDPHTRIDATDDELKRLRDTVVRRGFVVGSLVAPVWPPTGGGPAMGSEADRKNFLTQVRKACRSWQEAARSWDSGHRRMTPLGPCRASGPRIRGATHGGSPRRSRKHATSPKEAGERLAAEGEICWGGMHSWKRMVQLPRW